MDFYLPGDNSPPDYRDNWFKDSAERRRLRFHLIRRFHADSEDGEELAMRINEYDAEPWKWDAEYRACLEVERRKFEELYGWRRATERVAANAI